LIAVAAFRAERIVPSCRPLQNVTLIARDLEAPSKNVRTAAQAKMRFTAVGIEETERWRMRADARLVPWPASK
jgi:hypothetical protein